MRAPDTRSTVDVDTFSTRQPFSLTHKPHPSAFPVCSSPLTFTLLNISRTPFLYLLHIKFQSCLFLSAPSTRNSCHPSKRAAEIIRANMVSEASSTSSSDQEADIVAGKSIKRCSSSKSRPKKIARKVHKSEREKLKRDQLNILFLQLSKCLDSMHQNHGKASTLTETTKLVGDLVSQIECLKKENTSLLSESQYLIIEKNELKEENGALKGEIMDMQNKLGERIHSQQAGGGGGHGRDLSQLMEQNIFVKLSHQSHLVVIPGSSLQQAETYREEGVVAPSNHVIRRPHARYPSPWDSWPSQILDNQTHTAEALNISTDISKETVTLA